MIKRIVQILKKDAAHLWPQIVIFVAALVLFACEDPAYVGDGGLTVFVGLLYVVVPLSCWLLVTSVIQQEKTVGHEQYWLTRPFSRTDLLAAKALFLLAFVIVPVFVCQAVVLDVIGFSPIEHSGELLVKQIFFAALLLLPMAAIATVTRNLAHAFLGGLLLSLVLAAGKGAAMSLAPSSDWGGLEWIRDTAVAAIALCGTAAVIYLQYTRRRPALGRAVLAGTAVLVLVVWTLPPWQSAFAFQSWFSKERVDPQEVRISFVPGQKAAGAPPDSHRRDVYYNFPIRIDNLSPGLNARVDWVMIEAPWRSAWSVPAENSGPAGVRWLAVRGDDRMSGDLIHVRGRLDLTVTAPSASECRVEAGDAVYCFWSPWALAPFPTSPWFGPIEKYKGDVEHPVAYIQRSFDLGPLRLADYNRAMLE